MATRPTILCADATITFHDGHAQRLDRCIRIDGTRITGFADDPSALGDDDADVIEFPGPTLQPGLLDAHNHQATAARDVSVVSTAHVQSLDALIETLRDAADGVESGWISTERNLTLHQLALDGMPSAAELDRASSEVAIAVRFGAHSMALNSKALTDSGLAALDGDPPNGRLERDDNGQLRGPIHEYGAMRLVDAHLAVTSDDELVANIAHTQRRYAASGLTAIRLPGLRPGEFRLYQRVRDAGDMVTRVFGAVRVDPNLAHDDKIAFMDEWPVRSGFGDDWFCVDCIKMFVDQGAITPVGDSHYFVSASELSDLVFHAARGGWGVALHAVRNEAVDMALDAYARVRKAGLHTNRLTVEHALLATPSQLQRFVELDVWWSPQPALLELAVVPADDTPGGIVTAPLATARKLGVKIGLGSDWNATPGTDHVPYSPFRTMQLATRHEIEASGERIDRATAYYLHSRAIAELARVDDIGGLWPGALADIIVVDTPDLLDESSTIERVRPVATFVDGRRVAFTG